MAVATSPIVGSEQPDVETYLSMIDRIDEIWSAIMRPDGAPLITRVKDVNNAVAILGLSTHALRLAPQIAQLLRQNFGWLVPPLVRLNFECGITAQWVRHVPDGFEAFASEALRQRRNFIDEIERTALTFDRPVATLDDELATDWSDSTSSEGSARSFKQRCDDLAPGGDVYYVLYRYLSMTCHASSSLVDRYFADSGDLGNGVPTFKAFPTGVPENLSAHLTAASAVWAGRAVGMVLKKLPLLADLREELRRCARVLQIKSDLEISSVAWLRV